MGFDSMIGNMELFGILGILFFAYVTIKAALYAQRAKTLASYLRLALSLVMVVVFILVYLNQLLFAFALLVIAILFSVIYWLFFMKRELELRIERVKEKEAKGEIRGYSKWALDTLREGPMGAFKFFIVTLVLFVVIWGVFALIISAPIDYRAFANAIILAALYTLFQYYQVKKIPPPAAKPH